MPKFDHSTKNTKELFKKLNISNKTLSFEEKKKLDKEGYLIIKQDKFIKHNLKKFKKIIDNLITKEGKF